VINQKGCLTALTNLSKYITALWRGNKVFQILVSVTAVSLIAGGTFISLKEYGKRKAKVFAATSAIQVELPRGIKKENLPNLTSEQKEKSETPSTKGNFSQKGAIFAGEDGWVLLWDEPGRMALTVRLIFTDKSTCIFGGEEKDCGLINMGPESYDYASVEGDRDDGEVTVIKLEELKLPQ